MEAVTLQTVSKKPQNSFLVSDSHGNKKHNKSKCSCKCLMEKSENFTIITRQSIGSEGWMCVPENPTTWTSRSMVLIQTVQSPQLCQVFHSQ